MNVTLQQITTSKSDVNKPASIQTGSQNSQTSRKSQNITIKTSQ